MDALGTLSLATYRDSHLSANTHNLNEHEPAIVELLQ